MSLSNAKSVCVRAGVRELNCECAPFSKHYPYLATHNHHHITRVCVYT
jgi:hypothetical protein